ncbi:MAG: class I SAM-dependent methyltransferase [Terracidiphilus sp.]
MSESVAERFRGIWKGGYFEGNPADPISTSTYGIFGFHSSLYLTYRLCIMPYIRPDTTVIEIGPGRGAWTKAIADLGPKQIYAVDVVTPEHAGFWDYVGPRNNLQHLVVDDFSLSCIPDCSADYFFSFGCFCHLKPEMCVSYINSLSRKMKPGANGFLMIADYDKFNACQADYKGRSLWKALSLKRLVLLRWAFRLSMSLFPAKLTDPPLDKSVANDSDPSAWYHFGVDRACASISEAGFRVIERDMQTIHRDPIIHFVKL